MIIFFSKANWSMHNISYLIKKEKKSQLNESWVKFFHNDKEKLSYTTLSCDFLCRKYSSDKKIRKSIYKYVSKREKRIWFSIFPNFCFCYLRGEASTYVHSIVAKCCCNNGWP